MFTFKSSIYDKITYFLFLDHIQQFPSLNHVLVYDLRKCQNFQKVIIIKPFQLLTFSIQVTFRNFIFNCDLFIFNATTTDVSRLINNVTGFINNLFVIFTCGWILVCRAKTSWILWEITREQHSWTTVLEDRPPHPSRASLKLHEVMWTWKIIKSSVKSRPTSFSTWLHTLCVASANGFCFYNQLFN